MLKLNLDAQAKRASEAMAEAEANIANRNAAGDSQQNILQQMLFMQQQQQKSMAAATAEAQRQQMAFMQNMQAMAEENARRVAALETKIQPWQGTPRKRQSSNRNDGVSNRTELPTQNAGGDPKQERPKKQLPSLNLSSVQK